MKSIHYNILRIFAIWFAFIYLIVIFRNSQDLLLSIISIVMFLLYSSMALDCDISYEKLKSMEI